MTIYISQKFSFANDFQYTVYPLLCFYQSKEIGDKYIKNFAGIISVIYLMDEPSIEQHLIGLILVGYDGYTCVKAISY